MTSTIILFIVMLLYYAIMEYAKREALQGVRNSSHADEACAHRKRFALVRLCVGIPFALIALYLIFSSANAGINAVMVGLCYAWSEYQQKQAKPLSGKRPADIKGNNFILYLRGFTHDDYTSTYKELSRKRNKEAAFSEAHFISLLKQFMPVYAVGMTKELTAPIGARRIYLNDAEWEQEVIRLMERARLIVILLHDSESCVWEIAQADRFLNKTVFIADESDKISNVRSALNRKKLYPLPLNLKAGTLSYHSEVENRTKIVGFRNDTKSYLRLIKSIMHEKFGLRRWVITQRRFTCILMSYALPFFMVWVLYAILSGHNVQHMMLLGIVIYLITGLLPFGLYHGAYLLRRNRILSRTPADK